MYWVAYFLSESLNKSHNGKEIMDTKSQSIKTGKNNGYQVFGCRAIVCLKLERHAIEHLFYIMKVSLRHVV